MISQDNASEFVKKWINGFNSHGLDAIMEHYADDIEFYSPFILLLNFNEEGLIKNKADLRKYFATGLNAYPDLAFQIAQLFCWYQQYCDLLYVG